MAQNISVTFDLKSKSASLVNGAKAGGKAVKDLTSNINHATDAMKKMGNVKSIKINMPFQTGKGTAQKGKVTATITPDKEPGYDKSSVEQNQIRARNIQQVLLLQKELDDLNKRLAKSNKAKGDSAQKAGDQQEKAARDAQKAEEAAARAAEKALNAKERAFDRVINATNRMVNGLRQMAQGFQEIGFVLTTFVTAPLMLMLRNGTQGAMEFEYQMAAVRKAVEMDTPEGYTKLEQRLRNLAKITPTTATELAVMAEQAGQLGIKNEGVYRFVNLVNKAVIGTGVAADQFATEIGRVAAALGMDLNTEKGMGELEKLVSVMDVVAKKTSTDVNGIITAMQDAAVVGGMLETLAPQDLVAGLGVLITSGVDPTAAGTNLQRWYIQVMKNSDKFAESMKGYVREVRDANGDLIESFEPYKDVDEVIQRINDEPIQVLRDSIVALNSVAEEDRAQALKNYFDFSGLVGGRVGAMASNIQAFDDILKQVDEEWAHAIELQMDYERMLQTTDSAVKIFKNNLNDLGITLGNYVMPYINQAIEVLIPLVQDLGKEFQKLPESTKKLVIIIPLVAAVLGPVMFVLFSFIHALALMGSGLVSSITGFGTWVFQLVRFVSKLGGTKKLLSGVTTTFSAITKGTAAASGAGSTAVGIFSRLIGVVMKFGGWIVGIPMAILGGLKVLTLFGLNISQYFEDLASRAKAWGEKLMITYGNGMLAGAARAVSKVISTVAGWIANFFEAHSPPEEGPLSTIDQWGSAVMNTYLKGFLNADFNILSEVGNRIERAFEIFASLNNIELGTLNETFMKFRENISQVIDTFNKTGQVAEDVLGQIGNNLGTLGKDIQELVRLWLTYKQLQEKLAALDRKKKDTLKTYDAEIAKISKMNITAEEKAELIRQAQLNRDDELRQIEQEKKSTEEQAEAAKEKLDWQKEYIDAQLEFLELLKKDKEKKGSGGGGDDQIEPVDFGGMEDAIGGLGDPVKDLGEEFNLWSEKIDKARSSLDIFKEAFKGESSWKPLSASEEKSLREDDPEAYKKYEQDKSMYELGTKAGEIWRSITGPITTVKNLIDRVNIAQETFNSKIDGLKEKMGGFADSPFVQALQTIFDAAANNTEVFDPLTRAFDSLNTSLEKAKESFKGAGDALGEMGITWQTVGVVIGVVIGVIIAIIAGLISIIINVVMVVVEFIVRIVGHIIESVAGFIEGFAQMFAGLWDIIIGLCTGNWQRVLEGIVKFGEGLYNAVHSAWTLVVKVMGDIIEGAVALVIRLFSDIIAFILRLFGQNDVADKVQEWADNAIGKIREWIDRFYGKLDDLKGKIKGWVDTVLGWLDKFTFLDFSFNADLNTTNTGSGIQPNYRAAGGITLKGKPELAWIGEGGEQEAIIPLSKLPGLMAQMYVPMQAPASSGIVLNINNPVVREDQDIDKIADAVSRKLSKKTSNSSRMI